MTGIAELFEEFSRVDEFQLAFDFEQFAGIERRAHAERQRERYRMLRLSSIGRAVLRSYEQRPERREYKRNWIREYDRRKMQTDPAYAQRRRQTKKESMRRQRERRKLEQAA